MENYSELVEKLYLQQNRLSKNNKPMTQFLRGLEGLMKATNFLDYEDEPKILITMNICKIVSAYVVNVSDNKKSAEKLYEDIIDYCQDFEKYIK